MGHTKNHRRNNKKRQTKKYRVGGGGASEAEARNMFNNRIAIVSLAGDDKVITGYQFQNDLKKVLPGAAELGWGDVGRHHKEGLDFNDFLPIYYFAKANTDGDETLSRGEYTAAMERGDLPNMPSFEDVKKDESDSIKYKEFLEAYKNKNSPAGGRRRRRKRSTRNKRKTNKKRRTVKRRKSAKKSHRRK